MFTFGLVVYSNLLEGFQGGCLASRLRQHGAREVSHAGNVNAEGLRARTLPHGVQHDHLK
jgi:hypothetical protein